MTIADYAPEEAVAFWERMSTLGGGTLEFLSAPASDKRRVANSKGWIPEARAVATTKLNG
ncbi:MAG: hypothetical protein LBK73_01625 [Treponema sp.]|jgi:hypothetical protein|nr:hypothetical protein [Treponema sp.]